MTTRPQWATRRLRSGAAWRLLAVLGILALAACGAQPTEPIAAPPTPTTAMPTVPAATATEAVPALAQPQALIDGLREASELAEQSKIEEAIERYRSLAVQYPQEASPEVGWAWAYIYDDDAAQALPHALRAVELDGASVEARAVLSRAYAASGDTAQALASALEAVALSLDSAQARAMLADAHRLNGQNEAAIRAAERAVELDGRNADAHRARGLVFLAVENRPEEGAAELQTAAANQPQLWLRRHELGLALLQANYPDIAVIAFEDAVALRSKAESYAGLGEAHYRLGQYDLARQALEHALKLGQADANTFGLLAGAYAQVSRCAAARRFAQQALDLDPAQPQALEARVACAEETTVPMPATPTATAGIPVVATPKPTQPATLLDGWIAFPAWNLGSGKYDTYMARAQDGSLRRLAATEMHQPALSPDGGWLALNGEGPDRVNLFLVKTDGSSEMEITPFAEDGQPAWSPDGKKLVLASFRHGDKQPRIYFLDDIPFGGGRVEGRPLNSGTDDVRGQMPAWTSDGRIVFRGCDLSSPREGCNGLGLFVAPVAPGAQTPKRLTDNPDDSAPAVFGGRVVFMSKRDGDWELYAMDLDGSQVVQLTQNEAQDGLPTWSPDGKMIAFVSDQGGSWAVWVMAPDGSGRRRLFDVGAGGLQPDWTQERISWGP